MIQELSITEWEKGSFESLTYLYLYTPLCGTCKVGEKMLEVVMEMLPDVPLYKMNINLVPQLAEEWRIESVPCLISMQDKTPIHKVYAMRSVVDLYKVLTESL
ncbi:thioredoxin family protein [Ammoniphilus sp. YIM 78166]|uniref:thioredoxin family protein n=1 Tax=Ammoniphilus sp. YIM 78166 TaxID=1644106 RepID=UPI00106FB371|nr:thioredoxin family protein [Ammoniphilus sp. YIM 78166]